jgi:hypothetical protein
MINLDYYYRTDIYEVDTILSKGIFFDYFKTSREYGFAIYTTDKPTINLNNKPLILDIHLKSLDNILIVTNFQQLLDSYLVPFYSGSADVASYVDNNGKTARLGTKYIQPFLEGNNYTGLKVTSENLLVLYKSDNIKYIELYNNQ